MKSCLVMAYVLTVSVASVCLAQSTAVQGNAAPAPATAAPASPATTSPADAAAAIPKGTLGPQYTDGSFGFALRPLAGASFDRRKRTVESRMQLAQFVRLDIGWSMAVRLWSTERAIDLTAAKDEMDINLKLQYPDANITQADPVRLGSRDAFRLSASFSADGQNWLRQQAVIPLRAKDYVMVVLTTPGDDREIAIATFGQILESFQIVRTELQQTQIDAALEKGIALRQQLAGAAKKITDMAAEPIFLRLSRDGQPVGCVEIREKPTKVGGKDGVQSLQQAWIFNPDQSVQFLQEDRFLAADLEYDEWRNMSQLMPSKQVDPKQRLVVNMEAGIHRKDQLVVRYAGTGITQREDKAIEVEQSYAPTAWPLLLPRLIDLKTPELFAFSTYDSERRGMVLRTLRVVGPDQATIAGRRVSGYKIEDSEGLLPPVNEIFVDATGRLIRLSSGPVEMTVATQDQIEKEFGERIRTTQKQFRENAGIPEAAPQADATKNADAQNKATADAKAPTAAPKASTKKPRSTTPSKRSTKRTK